MRIAWLIAVFAIGVCLGLVALACEAQGYTELRDEFVMGCVLCVIAFVAVLFMP